MANGVRRWKRRRSTVVVALGLLTAACSSTAAPADEPAAVATASTDPPDDAGSEPGPIAVDAPAASTNADDPADAGSNSVESPDAADEPAGRDADCPPSPEPDGEHVEAAVEVTQVGEFDGGTVHAASYPLPDDLGTPWSQWGQGVVLPDGRFVSGVGDHRGEDGRSWFYEFDPATGRLARTTEVGPALGHEDGDWGYGKIHAPMVLDECDRIVTTTYWGSRRGLTLGGSYSGDHVIRYDPSTREIESLGVPVEGHGLPSLAIAPGRSRLYVEAVDPESDPDAGDFVVIDVRSGEVLSVDDSADHIGFRDVLVTGDGTALYATTDSGLRGVTADGVAVEEPGVLGDGWLRSASEPSAAGSVAVVTRRPDALHVRTSDGSMSEVREFEGYVASIALAPDGRTAYYVPGAHGDSYELGAPLMATDIETGETSEIVRLNDLVEPVLDVGLGGTFNVAVDPSGDRVFVGFNGSADAPDEKFGEVVLVVVELDGS